MIDTQGIEAELLAALREVEDPELPVSVVDMGLIVYLSFNAGTVDLAMTFTAMGCPAIDMIVDDVTARLLREPQVERVNVDVVWEPIWTKERLSEEGKSQLREWGISV